MPDPATDHLAHDEQGGYPGDAAEDTDRDRLRAQSGIGGRDDVGGLDVDERAALWERILTAASTAERCRSPPAA